MALDDWDDVAQEFAGGSLLLGNGSSCAVWSRFRYASLYRKACSHTIAHRLDAGARALFDAMNTSNFERVLRSLRTASTVLDALGYDTHEVNELAERVRTALIEAVEAVHVAPGTVGEEVREAIANAFLHHNRTFTTNYDLIAYWALMMDPPHFTDLFIGGCFDSTNTQVYPPRRPVYYLHGAIHLYRGAGGRACKVMVDDVGTLLELFANLEDHDPLFVSEGTPADKMRVIRSSDYLSYVYEQLANDNGPLVVFGHRLSLAHDRHIVRAIDRDRPIAISMRPSGHAAEVARKAAYTHALPHAELTFFDATTHTLGDPGLSVDE